MRRRLATATATLLIASACSNTPSPSPSSIPITLRAAPSNFGCEAVGVPYRSVTFRIDATADDQVIAVADTGGSLQTFWSAGFAGGSSDDRVVRDPAGSVVARDGQVLPIPARAWPRLAGYFVCPYVNAVYVLLVDPQ